MIERESQSQGISSELAQSIERYYAESESDYKLFWHVEKTHSLHYGYHRQSGIPHNVAVIEMIRMMANKVGINASDIVLDAGCGVGGSSTWIARNTGAKVIGIDISETQLSMARKYARPGVEFRSVDFTSTTFMSESFTVFWALESSCHAPDKLLFLQEAYRLLKPGGRVIIADGFASYPDAKMLEGWAVPNLAGVDQFNSYMWQVGFGNVYCEDITKYVMPSSRRMYMAAMSVYPFHVASKFVKFRTGAQRGNVEAALEQYKLLSTGGFTYCVFTGVK